MNSNEFIAHEDDFLKRVNDIFISQKQIDILEKYGIDIKRYKNINELIYQIEIILNDNNQLDDLEWVSEKLSEYNYYVNTNK